MRALFALIAALLVGLSGCSMERDPEKTVLVEVSSISDDANREQVKQALKGLLDSSSHYIRTEIHPNQIVAELYPVRDIEAFSRRIEFGTVTAVQKKERIVRVKFVAK